MFGEEPLFKYDKKWITRKVKTIYYTLVDLVSFRAESETTFCLNQKIK